MPRHEPTSRPAVVAVVTLLFVSGVTLLARQSPERPPSSQATESSSSATDPRVAILEAEHYVTPPDPVRGAVMATAIEDVRLSSPDAEGQFFLRTVGDGFPTLERFARRHYDLGQLQIDPAANRSRRLTTRSDAGLEIYGRDGRLVTEVDVPDGARVSAAQWSPDGTLVAFLAHFDDATHVYVADRDTGDARRLTSRPVLATHVTSFDWARDGDHIVTVLVPADRGPEPAAPTVPETPKVRMTTPERNALRTYFDLLENPHEKALVRYYSTGQLARIDVRTGDVQPIGQPAMIEGIDVSPDGEYVRVTRMKPELSYIVPVSSAGSVEEVWDLQGRSLVMLDEDDLDENVQDDDADDDRGANDDEPERRGLRWHGDSGAVLTYLQLEPRAPRSEGGTAGQEPAAGQEAQEEDEEDAPRQDRVMLWRPPFDASSAEVLYATDDRLESVRFDESGRWLFLSREDDGTETLHAVSLDAPDQEFLIYEDDTEAFYERPGSLMTGGDGSARMSSDGRFVYLEGTEYFEDPAANAPRPFVDRVEVRTGDTTRVFRSSAEVHERVDVALDDDLSEVIVTRQSSTMAPNQWLVNVQTGESRQLTFNEDHHPSITAARRELVTVTRPDGFTSRVEVTLPAGHRPGEPLPAMFWFYPREYSEQEDYDEGFRTYNKNDFPNVGARSMEILTLLGYALVEPDVPIVGPQGQQNDEYPHDLRNTLAAVIDELDERGWIDRRRLGIGGHSYGAFGTANAMIQTPFFRAGIAGDGNYNRSLTPAGFQRERRYLWEAQDLYVEMSPFFQADRLSGALLMYHGMDDHNVGTHPIHADRMFHALEVLGKTAAMYKYPFEDHGPATGETLLDLWARWIAWLDLHVMDPLEVPVDPDGGR